MKKLYSKQNSSEQMENNLIPMINIIFLLLIFFMIAGHISRQAKPKELTLAAANSQQKVKSTHLNLSITKEGQYYLDDVKTSLGGIQTFFEKNQKVTELNLQVDKQVTSGEMDELLDILRASNVGKVAIVVKKESDE